MSRALLLVTVIACSTPPAAPAVDVPSEASDASIPLLPPSLQPGDFTHPLDRAYIRSFQTWIDDATFDVKWSSLVTAPIDFLGGASSAFHADLASLPTPLPGGEVLCHGDAKLDNFGWTRVDGETLFGANDFDDAGACPAAADILHYLVATDLWFSDPSLDEAALAAYVDVLISDADATAIDATTAPNWDSVHTDGLDKATKSNRLVLGGEVQAATSAERNAVFALVAADARFPTTLLDVARDVRTDGGSAGLRRFWLLVEDALHPRTIIELKELTTPGTEFGPHSTTYDDANRFDVLKPYWWGAPDLGDHFTVYVAEKRFVARDRFMRTNIKPTKMTAAQIANAVRTEASIMASKHLAAWAGFDLGAVKAWLHDSAAVLAARWRTAYSVAQGRDPARPVASGMAQVVTRKPR